MSLLYSTQLPEGWEAAEFSLPTPTGKELSLKDFIDKKGTLIIFTCNHCPYAQAAWPTLIELDEKFKENINFVAINPNDDTVYPEDSLEGMKDAIKDLGIPFPYLRDEEQEIAKAYDAQCTPEKKISKLQ